MSRQSTFSQFSSPYPLPAPALEVLLLGCDAPLLSYREQVLRHSGLRTGTLSLGKDIDLCALHWAEVTILCHTLSQQNRQQVRKALDHLPAAKCLIALDNGRITPDERLVYAEVIDNLAGPLVLIKAVHAQLELARNRGA